MKCMKDGRIVEVSKKAFRCIYQPQGYTAVEQEASVMDAEKEETAVEQEAKSPSEMKVAELRLLAKEHGIEGVDSLSKPELLEVLKDVV